MSSTLRAATESAARPSVGFPPVARPDARILVLGSLPGVRSLEESRYYAHPRNAFWSIMGELCGARGDYAARCAKLSEHGVALWDVLQSSVRPGSLDADIDPASARPNDFTGFFASHPHIRQIGFNGRKSAELFGRLVAPGLDSVPPTVTLPSTSPAFAAMPVAEKLERWRTLLEMHRT